jgi:hypothetical protein
VGCASVVDANAMAVGCSCVGIDRLSPGLVGCVVVVGAETSSSSSSSIAFRILDGGRWVQ